MKAKCMSGVQSDEIPGYGLAHVGPFSVGHDFVRTIRVTAGEKEVGEIRKPAGGWQSVIALGCFLTASVLSGCAAAVLAGAAGGAGVGAAAYVEGEHSQVHNAPMDRTWMATLAALKQMDIRVDTSNKDALGGNIVAKRADGTDVKIKEGPADTPNTTWVKIRIGVFEDQKDPSGPRRTAEDRYGRAFCLPHTIDT